MTDPPATINDVAAAAGVSRQTVTRAVNNMAGISADTRDRVLAAARELQYRPSRFGRGLVNPTTRTLGLLIDDLGNPYYAELASEILDLASAAGWNVILAERAHTVAGHFPVDELASQVDAIISFISVGLPPSRDGLSAVPLVEIDPPAAGANHGRVELNRERAIADAVGHLHERGVRQPVILDQLGPSLRAVQFAQAFDRIGVESVRIGSASTGLDGGFQAGQRVLAERPGTDAVVAFNDVMALGALRALQLAGVAVPGRIRVLGVDGLEIGRFVSPRLSTLALDMPLVARTALDLVLTLHANGRSGVTGIERSQLSHRIDYTFDIGEST